MATGPGISTGWTVIQGTDRLRLAAKDLVLRRNAARLLGLEQRAPAGREEGR
jgi:hypothetical protein